MDTTTTVPAVEETTAAAASSGLDFSQFFQSIIDFLNGLFAALQNFLGIGL